MRSLMILAAAAALSTASVAQSDQDHAAHHPDAASAPATSKKAPTKPAKAPKSSPQAKAASPAASGMPMNMTPEQMQQMHKAMHEPGGMHDQMHGKDGTMMGGGQMSGMQGMPMPAASAASQ